MTKSRKIARKVLNSAVFSMSNGAAFLSDLSDTATVANSLDELEDLVSDGDHSSGSIMDIAQEHAVEILEEEGFPMA